MTPKWPDEAAVLYRRALKHRLVEDPHEGLVMDRDAIERLLPHRDPFLLVHQVTHIDLPSRRLVARFPLAEAADILRGHFPGNPVYPGAMQIETVGQAAILLWCLGEGLTEMAPVALTHVLGARFMRPVGGSGVVEVAVEGIEDGLFTTAVGQVLYEGQICAVAGVRCVIDA